MAALNDVDILATDIGNAYLNADPREKVYTTAGTEFGTELKGRYILIVKALYGLKSSSVTWRAHFANTLKDLGFTSCLADPDAWFWEAKKPDCSDYYEYILVYVDNGLVLSNRDDPVMQILEKYYRLKDGFAKPTQYLGATVKEWIFQDEGTKPWWALSSEQYGKEAIKNIEKHLAGENRTLWKSNQPMPTSYIPELDITPLLQDDKIHFFQSQISMLRWMVELGRIDISVSMLHS